MQHLVEKDHVEAAIDRCAILAGIGKRQAIDVAEAHLHIGEVGAQQSIASDREHLRTDVNTHRPVRKWSDQLQHPTGARACIQEILNRCWGQKSQNRGLDILFRCVEGADTLPLIRIGAKVGRSDLRARGAHMGKACAVCFLRAWISQGRDCLAKLCPLPPVGRATENPAPLLESLHQAGLAQKLEMARDTRLALADNFDQFADRELGLAQQQKQAQPRRVARRTQHGYKPVHTIQHINISLYAFEWASRKALARQLGNWAGHHGPYPGKNRRYLILEPGSFMRAPKALIIGLCGLVLTSCAIAPPSPEALAANDPYEQMNRQTLQFNGKVDRYVVIPTVAVYFALVPAPGRRGVHNLLVNLSLPTTLGNDILQGEFKRASQSAERLLVNTTLGLGGFFDPASRMGIPGHGEDFGETLAVWGAQDGPYLILPFFGPSSPRDAIGLALDALLDPTNFIHFKQHIWWAGGREYFTLLDLRAQTYQAVQGIQRTSVDYYSSLRSLYRQMRAEQIRNGHQVNQNLPNF